MSSILQNKDFEWANDFIREQIIDIIFYYADNGDLQTSAFMIMVFRSTTVINGPKTKMLWDVNSVLRSYINLLYRIRCHSSAADIIKYWHISDIQNEYSKNFDISTKCQYCNNRESGKQIKCYYDKCGKFNSHWSLCDIPVLGRMWWCQHCGHGGHHSHMKQWFSKSTQCPVGCGHQCIDPQAFKMVFDNWQDDHQ